MSDNVESGADFICQPAVLHDFAARVLAGAGVQGSDAGFVAQTLVRSSLRGIDTHGIQLLPNLASRILDRSIDPSRTGDIVRETGTTAVLDGQNGVGQLVARKACDAAVRLAKQSGVGFVTIRNANHFGAGATWVEEIVRSDLIGLAACNTFPVMAPWGGRDARLGTNPLAVAVPCGETGPWLLDMATSTVAMSKLLVTYRKGEKSIPSGWALDATGSPTTDVRAALKGGTLLPMGGAKGAGLAMLVDILSGVLSGGAFGTDVGAFNAATTVTRTAAFIAAIDVGAFMPTDEFKRRMDSFITMMCSAAPAVGFERVAAPGQPEAAAAVRRQRDGIPLSRSLLDALQGVASKTNVAPLSRH